MTTGSFKNLSDALLGTSTAGLHGNRLLSDKFTNRLLGVPASEVQPRDYEKEAAGSR